MTMSLFTFVDERLKQGHEPTEYTVFFITKDGKLGHKEKITFAQALEIGKSSNNEYIVFRNGFKVKTS